MKLIRHGLSRIAANLRVLQREAHVKLRQHGAIGTLKLAIRRLIRGARSNATHAFDIEHGTDTSGIVEVGKLDLPESRITNAVRYQTAIVDVFTEMLDRVPIDHANFTFVDLGSGKGRALLIASRFPFKEIVGVELSPTLHAIACRNIEIYRDDAQCCHDVKSVCLDAASIAFPLDSLVIYMFNPFDDQVMAAVLARIEESLRLLSRSIYVLYLKPVHRQLFDGSSVFEVVAETPRYVIYASLEDAST